MDDTVGFKSLPTYRHGQLIPGGSAKGVLAADGLRAWRHTASGVRVILFSAPGPMTSANIMVGTLPISDAGHPHTLEHIVFLGSHLHPKRGYLDTLANRSLADGTNAYTDVDFTVYQADAAGFEGLSRLLPVFVDHVLRPRISKAVFMSEVYYTNAECKEAGVVFCEMHGREHTEEDLCQRALFNELFPDNPLSLSSGGICSHIRQLTAESVQKYHDDYYQGHNTSIVIGGSDIDTVQLLESLKPILDDIAKSDTRPRKEIPWNLESHLKPLPKLTQKQINFPCPDEDIGSVVLAWRGPPATQLFERTAINILLKYLVETVSSPLRQKFVECENPLSNYVSDHVETFLASSKIALYFAGVSHRDDDEEEEEETDMEIDAEAATEDEREKADDPSKMDVGDEKSKDNPAANEDSSKTMLTSGEFSKLVIDYLKSIVDSGALPGTLKSMQLTIKRERESYLAGLEEDSHELVPTMLIEEVIYADIHSLPIGDEARGKLERLALLEEKPEEYWITLLKSTFIDAPRVELFMTPDCTLAEKLAEVDSNLAKERVAKHGHDELVNIGRRNEQQIKDLEKAEFGENAFPDLPSAVNISRIPYNVSRKKESKNAYWAQNVAVYTDFIHTTLFFNTEKLNFNQRLVLPILCTLMFNSDVYLDDGTVIPFKDNAYAITGVTVTTEMSGTAMGYSSGLSNSCLKTHFTSTPDNALEAFQLICRAFFKERITLERLSTVSKNLLSDITEDLRDPVSVLHSASDMLPYIDANADAKDMPTYLLGSIIGARPLVMKMSDEACGAEKAKRSREIVVRALNDTMDSLRKLPSSEVFVQIGAREPTTWQEKFQQVWDSYRPSPNFGGSDGDVLPIRRVLPEINMAERDISKVIAVPGAENSYFFIRVDCDVYPGHEHWGALVVLNEMLCRMEGPLSDAIRKSGLAYGYGISNQRWKGYLRASIDETANPCKAWVAMVDKLIEYRAKFDSAKERKNLEVDLDTAKSVTVYGLNSGKSTPEYVVKGAVADSALGNPSSPMGDRVLEESVEGVTLKNVKNAFDTYIKYLFQQGNGTSKRRGVVTCGPHKVENTRSQFMECKYPIEFVECKAEDLVPDVITKAVDKLVKKRKVNSNGNK